MKPWNRIGHQELIVRKTGCGYLRNIYIYMEKKNLGKENNEVQVKENSTISLYVTKENFSR